MNYLTPHSIKPKMIIGEQKMKKKAFVVPAPDKQQKSFNRPKAEYQNESWEQTIQRVEIEYATMKLEGKIGGKK